MGAAALPAAIGMTAAGGAYSAFQQGQAGKMQAGYYSYLADTAATNASLAKAAGEANVRQVAAQAADQDRRLNEGVRATVGAQKAALVTGAGVGSKTGEQVISDTLNKGNLDEMALRYNADMKTRAIRMGADSAAFNYNNQAVGDRMAGSNALATSRNNQVSTILGTGGSVASSWYMGNRYGWGG